MNVCGSARSGLGIFMGDVLLVTSSSKLGGIGSQMAFLSLIIGDGARRSTTGRSRPHPNTHTHTHTHRTTQPFIPQGYISQVSACLSCRMLKLAGWKVSDHRSLSRQWTSVNDWTCGERYELPRQSLGQSPSRNWIWCIIRLTIRDVVATKFSYFPENLLNLEIKFSGLNVCTADVLSGDLRTDHVKLVQVYIFGLFDTHSVK